MVVVAGDTNLAIVAMLGLARILWDYYPTFCANFGTLVFGGDFAQITFIMHRWVPWYHSLIFQKGDQKHDILRD
jgi:hypothetical protein